MYGDENTGKIQHCRQNRHQRNPAVRNTGELRHQEGSRTHNRRHNLSAGGGSGFNCRRKFRLIAHPLHHRNGDGTGTDRVGHRGTGSHAFQRGSDNRYFSRTAGKTPDSRIGKADKEIRHARALQKCAENDKNGNVFYAHGNRRGKNPVSRIKQCTHHLERPDTAQQRIQNQYAGYAKNGQTDAPAAQFHQRQNPDNADGHKQRIRHNLGGKPDDGHGVDRVKEKRAGTGKQDDDVIPWHMVGALHAFTDRKGQKAEEYYHAEENRITDFLQRGEENCIHDAIHGESRHQPVDQPPGQTFPNADVGLPVVFFHHGFHIRHRADGHVCNRLHRRGSVLFLFGFLRCRFQRRLLMSVFENRLKTVVRRAVR